MIYLSFYQYSLLLYYICPMKLRIKKVAKLYGYDLKTLAKKLNISYQALNARMSSNVSTKIIQEVADAIGCSVFEIIEADNKTDHHYNEHGHWLGIRVK